jgi:16S rRNA (adenine1518-N6/adenine1519-N6)-dimethyltransferase
VNYGPPRKRFGQHFLHDPRVLDRILAAIEPGPDDHVVEIGPGRGALTRPLVDRVRRLDVIELDRDLARQLPAEIASDRLHVHEADALRFDYSALGDELRLVGNLPYNISTPLLFHLLGYSDRFRDLHVMLQKEVVERMAAAPGGREYGRLTVALGARCRVEKLFIIKPGAFTPPPRVDSAFARLVPDPERQARITCERSFDRVVQQAFSMRRKRLSNSLRGLVDASDLESLGIDPGSRPQTLDVRDYVRIANFYAAQN